MNVTDMPQMAPPIILAQKQHPVDYKTNVTNGFSRLQATPHLTLNLQDL